MAQNLKIYDSSQVIFTFTGITVESGRGEEAGEFLTIEYDNDAFDDVVSADGQVSRSKTKDNRAVITVTIMSTSDSNILFSTLHNVDKKAANGAGVGAIAVKDLSGTSLFAGAEAWIMKAPDVKFARVANTREWKIRVANLESLVGGN